MSPAHRQTWTIRKSVVRATAGLVAAQDIAAAEVGAGILAAGGNAVDAAIATSLALCVLEPWMSGLGGGGFMVIGKVDGGAPEVIDFGAVAPASLDPAAYPLALGRDHDLFGWPAVLEGRNLLGRSRSRCPARRRASPPPIATMAAFPGQSCALRRSGSRRAVCR